MKQKKILVRVDGNREIGLGHVYNMLTILENFKNDEILILMNNEKKLGYDKLKKSGFKIKFFKSNNEMLNIIQKYEPEMIFNDILNTSEKYMKKIREYNSFIVNFEDLGKGRKIADLVFNPIYFSKNSSKTEFYGEKFACVRKEFRGKKIHSTRKNVKKISISFGGTDPTNKTIKVLKILHMIHLKNIEINVILGLGFLKRDKIKTIVKKMNNQDYKISIIEKPDNISKYIHNSDFTITSNGRTVFEIGAMEIPMIAIAVNNREKKHSFVKYSEGGYHIDATSNFERKLPKYIKKMLDYENRKRFSENLSKKDLLNGTKRLSEKINSEFKKFR